LVKNSTHPMEKASLILPVSKKETRIVSSVPVARQDTAFSKLR